MPLGSRERYNVYLFLFINRGACSFIIRSFKMLCYTQIKRIEEYRYMGRDVHLKLASFGSRCFAKSFAVLRYNIQHVL